MGTFGVALLAILTLTLTFGFLPSRYDLREGEVSPYIVKSPATVTYVSQIGTRDARQAAAAAVPDVYTFEPKAADQQRQLAVLILRRLSEIRQNPTPLEAKRDSVAAIPDLVLSPHVIDSLLALDEPGWQAVSADTLRVLDRVMGYRITEKQLEDVRASLAPLIDPSLPNEAVTVVAQLARTFVKPNYVVDAEATARTKKEAQDKVTPVRVTVERGETILRDGERVSPEQLEGLKATGLSNPTFRWQDLLAVTLLAGFLVTLLAGYLYAFRPALADDSRRLLLLGLVVAVTVLAAKLGVAAGALGTYYIYLFPSAAAAMLVALLFDGEVALVVTALLAGVIGLASSASFDLTLLTLVVGAAGVLSVWRLERFTTILRAGAKVGLAGFGVGAAFDLSGAALDPQRLGLIALAAAAGGLLSAVITLSAVYFLGQGFEISTTLGLLELAHPSQPLFRRLLVEAPGTYHHSVVIANLAERAAEVIGADPLLCRIGAYYHDIGKVVRPYAFIENQASGENVHDRLEPATSARIIISHVSDGLALACRYRLPRRVRDLIPQHHGTALAGYFHRKACEAAGHQVDEGPFRYPGPRPRSREAAILMLADGVEAAVRSNPDHSTESIETAIQNIVGARTGDGQLNESGLTLGDLDKLKATFASVFQGIYHPRIEYPALPLPAEGARAAGDEQASGAEVGQKASA